MVDGPLNELQGVNGRECGNTRTVMLRLRTG